MAEDSQRTKLIRAACESIFSGNEVFKCKYPYGTCCHGADTKTHSPSACILIAKSVDAIIDLDVVDWSKVP